MSKKTKRIIADLLTCVIGLTAGYLWDDLILSILIGVPIYLLILRPLLNRFINSGDGEKQ